MNEVTRDSLYKLYPLIFTDSFRGFEIPNGWLSLLGIACNSIQTHIDITPGALQLEAIQVKSKFAEMRFYKRGGDTFCDGVISMAEGASRTLCELCGTKGTLLYRRGCLIVRCPEHLNFDSF